MRYYREIHIPGMVHGRPFNEVLPYREVPSGGSLSAIHETTQ